MRDVRLLKLLARNLAIGSLVAVGTVGGLVASDAHGLRGLLARDNDPLVATLLLVFGFVITLGSAAMGAAIMSLQSTPPADRRGRAIRAPGAVLQPATARSRTHGRRAES